MSDNYLFFLVKEKFVLHLGYDQGHGGWNHDLAVKKTQIIEKDVVLKIKLNDNCPTAYFPPPAEIKDITLTLIYPEQTNLPESELVVASTQIGYWLIRQKIIQFSPCRHDEKKEPIQTFPFSICPKCLRKQSELGELSIKGLFL